MGFLVTAALTIAATIGEARTVAVPSPSHVLSWASKLRAVQEPLDGCALERLLDEMATFAAKAQHTDRDFADSYCEATCVALLCPASTACVEPSLANRVERARAVAIEWSHSLDVRLRVENEYAKALVQSSRQEEAQQVLFAADKAFSTARATRAETLQLLVNLTSLRCQFAECDELGERCERLLDDLLSEERASKSTSLMSFHLFLRTELDGDLAHAHLKMGHPDRAATDLDREESACRELGGLEQPNSTVIRLGLDRAEFALAVHDFDGCVARCEEIEKLGLEPEPDERTLLRTYKAVAASHLVRMNRLQSEAAARQFEDIVRAPNADALTRAQCLEGLADLDLRAGDAAGAEQRLDELASVLAGAGATSDPCHWAELLDNATALRASCLLQRNASTEALASIRNDLEQRCDEMFARQAAMPLRKGGIGFWHWSVPRELLSARIRMEIALRGESSGAERGLETMSRAQTLGTMARTLGASSFDLGAVRDHLLSQGIGLLVYLPALDGSHLFLVDRRQISHRSLAPRDALVAAVSAYKRTAFRRPDTSESGDERASEIRSLGEKLRDLLLPPDAAAMMRDWTGFYVVGTDLIGSPALEPLPSASGRELGIDYAICQLPSIPVGIWLAERAERELRGDAVSHLLVFGGPRHTAEVQKLWPRLKPFELADDDARALERSFEPGEARFLVRDDATRVRLGAALAQPTDVLEVFTHGVYAIGKERPAGLVVGEDDRSGSGVLSSEDVETGVSSPRIVALFACGSALGPSRMGDDSAAQLGNAFLERGAQTVVLSRGELAYAAMIELARSFNTEIRTRGTSVAEALRAARAKLVEDPRWRDPFYFGQVSAFGIGLVSSGEKAVIIPRANGPRERGSEAWVKWGTGLLVMLTLLGLVAWRRNRARAG